MIKLKIYSKNHQFSGDTNMPLLWVLRDEPNIKGTKTNRSPREGGNK